MPVTTPRLYRFIWPLVTLVLLCTTLYLIFYTRSQDATVVTLHNERNTLTNELASTTAAVLLERDTASTTIHELSSRLSLTEEELSDIEDDLHDEKNRNEDFEDQIKEISGTVGILDKLSKTDEELLQKYSKVYFLNENYIPSDIKPIDSTYVLAGRKSQFFHGDALPYLEEMIEDAADDDITLKVLSAYRSFNEQAQLKGAYTQTYGSGANTFSADQGYSEHQLGTTLDLSDPVTAGTYVTFKNTTAYKWMQANAYKYGFILSYPEANRFYVFEPWHWRFVGTGLATDLHKAGDSYYDWEQRKIDTYLVSIFD